MIDVECPRFGRELRPVDRNREAHDAFVRIVVLIHALSKVIVEIVRRQVALCDGDRPDNGARQRGARRCGARVRFAPGSARRSREERQGRQQKREKRKKRSSDHEFAPKPLPQRLLLLSHGYLGVDKSAAVAPRARAAARTARTSAAPEFRQVSD